MNAPIGKISWNDVFKGIYLTVLVTILAGIEKVIECKGFNFTSDDWNTILIAACLAAGGYIGKQLTTNSKDQILQKEPDNTLKPIQ